MGEESIDLVIGYSFNVIRCDEKIEKKEQRGTNLASCLSGYSLYKHRPYRGKRATILSS